jgi:peptidoglycan/xylan/chitin deacetylase (PgdA/CDA1 family)
MFFDDDLKGDDLPPKTLCLTYDDGPGATVGDGPGPRTRELGRFLAEEGIAATFFVVGEHARQHEDVLEDLANWGHLVANHTFTHPGLVALATSGGDVVGELEHTDEVIRPYVSGPVTYFRAPYGNWRELRPDGSDEPTSIVARILNESGRLGHYIGPVNWDIVAEDWTFWEQGRSAEECARAYLDQIERVGRGIVLMHDSSEDPETRAHNLTTQATALIVPALKSRGYRFVRLDEVPQVASAGPLPNPDSGAMFNNR